MIQFHHNMLKGSVIFLEIITNKWSSECQSFSLARTISSSDTSPSYLPLINISKDYICIHSAMAYVLISILFFQQTMSDFNVRQIKVMCVYCLI